MTDENKELIITKFKTNRKGFYAWLFCNKSRQHLVDELRLLFPNADSDLERVYWLVFNLTEAPVCPVCGKKIPFKAASALNDNGYNTHCCHRCGTADPHHQMAIKRTKLARYGDENWNNPEKARQTMLDRYGVEYYTSSMQINAMRNSAENQEKIQNTKRRNNTFNTSKPEEEYHHYLCEKYGEADIIHQYKDPVRYPFNCDFYVKSKDLFIELNLFPTHGQEPFDAKNENHINILEQCKTNPKNWVEAQMPLIWAGADVLKAKCAEQNKLNYIRIYKIEDMYNEESGSI